MTAIPWTNARCTLVLLILLIVSGCGGESATGKAGGGAGSNANANITGEWTLTIDTPRGVQNPKVTISETNGALAGTYESFRGPLDITRVTVNGNQFSFPLQITVPIGTIEVSYEGTIDGDRMTGLVKNPRGEVPFSGMRTGK